MPNISPTSAGAHSDNINQQFSTLGVQGTLGTSDTSGTAWTLPISVDPATGAQYVIDLSSDAGTNVNIASGTINLGTVVGNIAHDSPDSGNPVKVGAKYNSSLIAAVTNGDRTDLQSNALGHLIIGAANGGAGDDGPGFAASMYDMAGNERFSGVIPMLLAADGNTDRARGTVGTAFVAIAAGTVGSITNIGSISQVGTLSQAYAGTTNAIPGTISTFAVSAITTGYDGANSYKVVLIADADTVGADGNQLRVGNTNRVWNGASWDRMKGDTGGVFVKGTLNLGTFTDRIALTPSAAAIGTVAASSATLVGSNTSRRGLIIVNNSTNKVSLGINSAAVLNAGITLLSGGVYNMDSYNYVLGTITAIASAGTTLVGIQEYT